MMVASPQRQGDGTNEAYAFGDFCPGIVVWIPTNVGVAFPAAGHQLVSLQEGYEVDGNCASTAASSTSPSAEDASDWDSTLGPGDAAPDPKSRASTTARREQRVASEKPMDPSTCTTVIMQNIPKCYTRDELFALFLNYGFGGRIDFLFVPLDFATGESQAHAYVNLVSPMDAAAFLDTFNGFSRWWRSWSKEVCEASWSCFEQGLESNVERYRNSPVMHASVPDGFRPAIFSDGVRQPFPEPTRKVRPPRKARTHFGV